MPVASLPAQVRAVVAKNAKVRSRAGANFFRELALPAIYAASMLAQSWAKTKIDDPIIRQYQSTYAAPFPIGECAGGAPKILYAPTDQFSGHAISVMSRLLRASENCTQGYAGELRRPLNTTARHLAPFRAIGSTARVCTRRASQHMETCVKLI